MTDAIKECEREVWRVRGMTDAIKVLGFVGCW